MGSPESLCTKAEAIPEPVFSLGVVGSGSTRFSTGVVLIVLESTMTGIWSGEPRLGTGWSSRDSSVHWFEPCSFAKAVVSSSTEGAGGQLAIVSVTAQEHEREPEKTDISRFQLQKTLSFYPHVGSYLPAMAFAKHLLQTAALSRVLNTLSEVGEIDVVAMAFRLE